MQEDPCRSKLKFGRFVHVYLCPRFCGRYLIVWDNDPIYKRLALREAIQVRGARVAWQPRYSLGLSGLEQYVIESESSHSAGRGRRCLRAKRRAGGGSNHAIVGGCGRVYASCGLAALRSSVALRAAGRRPELKQSRFDLHVNSKFYPF